MRRRKQIKFTARNGDAIKYVYTDGTESEWVPVNGQPGDRVRLPIERSEARTVTLHLCDACGKQIGQTIHGGVLDLSQIDIPEGAALDFTEDEA